MGGSVLKATEKLTRKVMAWYGSRKSYFYAWHNTLGPFVNHRYRRWSEACRGATATAGNESAVRRVGSMLVPGVMPSDRALELSELVSCQLRDASAMTLGSQARPMMKKVDRPISRLGRDVVDIFHQTELNRRIREFFGCHFRIEWLDCYRSFPTAEVSHSWLWHSDNVPVETLKVMLHLTDAGEQQGATQFLSLGDTIAYFEAGYRGDLSRRVADLQPFASKHNLPYRPFSYDARAGDVMLFVNNALHRAVPPKEGYRDVLTFLLLPNPIPWDQQLEIDGIDRIEATPGGYPRNPARRAA